jgi:hypothetical protein
MLMAIKDFLQTQVAPHLKSFLGPLDRFLSGLEPWVWKACAIGFFICGGLFALCFKRSYIYQGAPDQAAWRDLRLWALLFLLPFIVVYWILG